MAVTATRLVVTGMPKSGTTAVAMLLGAASGSSVASDPCYQLDRAGIRFRDALYAGELSLSQLIADNRDFFRAELVKDPNFPFFMDELQTAFPSARFVFVLRDPRDNIRSILNRLELPGRPSDISGVAMPDPWRRMLEGRAPAVPGANYIECLAHRWRLAYRNYRAAADWMHLVRYEEFDDAKEQTVVGVLEQLGLPHDRGIDHLVDQQFQPKGDRSVSWSDFFAPESLEAIEGICGGEIESLRTPA